MMYLKWILLLVCMAYVLWPLLAAPQDHGRKEGKPS